MTDPESVRTPEADTVVSAPFSVADADAEMEAVDAESVNGCDDIVNAPDIVSVLDAAETVDAPEAVTFLLPVMDCDWPALYVSETDPEIVSVWDPWIVSDTFPVIVFETFPFTTRVRLPSIVSLRSLLTYVFMDPLETVRLTSPWSTTMLRFPFVILRLSPLSIVVDLFCRMCISSFSILIVWEVPMILVTFEPSGCISVNDPEVWYWWSLSLSGVSSISVTWPDSDSWTWLNGYIGLNGVVNSFQVGVGLVFRGVATGTLVSSLFRLALTIVSVIFSFLARRLVSGSLRCDALGYIAFGSLKPLEASGAD